MIRLILAALSTLCLTGLVHAETIVPDLDQKGRSGDIARMVYAKAVKQFDKADGDKDGKLSRKEVAKVSPAKAETFDKHDKDKDEFLSWPEFVGHDRWAK